MDSLTNNNCKGLYFLDGSRHRLEFGRHGMHVLLKVLGLPATFHNQTNFSWVELIATSQSTHNRSLWTRLIPGNRMHYWQLKQSKTCSWNRKQLLKWRLENPGLVGFFDIWPEIKAEDLILQLTRNMLHQNTKTLALRAKVTDKSNLTGFTEPPAPHPHLIQCFFGPRVSTPSICSAVSAQPAYLTDSDAGIINRNSPHLMYSFNAA